MSTLLFQMPKQDYKFEVIFTPQEEGGYTAEVLNLPGCVSEGETLKEAEENIHEAIELYLETLEDRGLPLPSPKSIKVIHMDITVSHKSSKEKGHV